MSNLTKLPRVGARMGVRTWLVAGALLCALAAHGQGLEFIEPAAGTVRGTVPVRVDLGGQYDNGYVTFYLGRAGEPLRFKVATVADAGGLYGFDWETQSQESKVADGEYRLLAIGYNGAGEVLGQKAVTVEVQNAIPASQVPERGLLLRYNLTPGRDARYIAESRARVTPGAGAEGNDVSMFNGGTWVWWHWQVHWRNADGRAYVSDDVLNAAELTARGRRQSLPATGKFASYLMEPDGDTIPRDAALKLRFSYDELTMELPGEYVKVGNTWRSPMKIVVDARTNQSDTVIGRHTLTGLEWHAGYRTAVIDSTFEGGPYRLTLKGEDSENEEWFADVTATLKGTRRTYFAYQPEVGRVLRVEERQNQQCMLELVEEPVAEMGMEGMMMDPGMMDPGMMMGMPGAGVLPGAGMPGAMEGMGMEAQQQKPAGFEVGGRALRPSNPKAAQPTGEGMMGEMGMEAQQAPPKTIIMYFNRAVQNDVVQDFLAANR